jgi:fructose-bisphosphate aldolase class II
MSAVESAAQRATVPVAIHLDHGMSLDSAIRSIRYGCNGVMLTPHIDLLKKMWH